VSERDGLWDEPPGCREGLNANYRGQKRVSDRRESSSVLLVNKPREVSTGVGITRRGLLLGVVAAPWVAACGHSTEEQPGVSFQQGSISSKFWPGQDVRWRLARPERRGAGSAAEALVIALHGYGGDADWPFANAHIERHVASTGLAVASVDGGNFYWHARKSGVDTSSLVVQDLLPLMGRKGLAIDRVGLIGWSMGGYGALLMATRLGRGRVAGVAAASAALWQSPADSAAGAFDDRDDFVRNDVFTAQARGKLRGMPVRLDCGRDDPFIVANRALARELPDAATTFDNGAHTEEYWTAHAEAQMVWLRKRFQ
jgi:dienelactone hydrolase